MEKPTGLCFRCEFRAQFHEAGHAPRMECGNAGKAIRSCYQYRPVKPFSLSKNENDSRPQFAGAMFSARSHAIDIPNLELAMAAQDKNSSVIYWVPKSLDDMHVKARDMLAFLEDHPALGSPVHNTLMMLEFDIAQICSNGQLKPHKGLVSVRYSPSNYVRFKKEFDAEFEEYSKEELKQQKALISVDIPYKTFYGYEWTPHRIEYWGELDFAVYRGKTFEDSLSRHKWERLSGIEAKGFSFQEMVVNLGTKFKKVFGNFDGEKLLTDKEKFNHRTESPFHIIDKTERITKMGSNSKWIHVSPAEINRRWVKWFAQTPYGKKHWANELKSILAGKENL